MEGGAIEDVEDFDDRDVRGDDLPVLSWTCFLCGTTHVSNVPARTNGNRLISVTCPVTGERRTLMAVPFFLLSR